MVRMDEYKHQRAIVAALNAELGARGWTRKQLAQRTGIAEQTLMRLFLCRRPMRLDQLGAMIDALGITSEHLVSEAHRWSRALVQESERQPRPTDPRELLQWLIDNPNADDVLQARLSEATEKTGLSGNTLTELRDEVVTARRRDLERSLRALTPSPKRASNH